MRDFENNPNEMNEDPYSDRENPTSPNEQNSGSKRKEETSKEPQREHPYDTNGPSYNSYAPYNEPPKKPKKSGGVSALLVVFCVMLSIFVGISAGALFGANRDVPNDTQQSTTDSFSSTTETDSGTESTSAITGETAPGVTVAPVVSTTTSNYSAVAKKCINSVVIINVTETSVAYGQEYTTSGAGSGVIYTKDGYIITNYHVANENTKTISVVLYDGSVYEGKYIYGDEFVDLAVIKIEKDDCDYATIGDFDQMQLGDEVLAIGNPLGYGLTVTDGIISALEREVTIENTTMTLLQTSAAINSGNSGGGLFNMKGELIGIVNAKIGGTSVEGMGYAIPSTTVVKSLNDLRDYGYITGKARLGVTVQTRQYQTWPYLQTNAYIQVTEIMESGSAAKSGLQVGDILYQFNGTEISSFEVLSQQLTKYGVGDTVTLTVRRPTIELTNNNLSEYLSTSETIELKITFIEFNPNA